MLVAIPLTIDLAGLARAGSNQDQLSTEASMRTTMSSNVGTGHRDDHATAHLAERTLVHVAATAVGIFFVFLGFGGFVYPDYMGLHLNTTHSVIHLVAGAVSIYFGLLGTTSGASLLCVTMGTIYGALAIAGFAFGVTGVPTVGSHNGMDTYLLKILPGSLELAVRDHILHAVIAAAYLASGLLGWLGTDEDHR